MTSRTLQIYLPVELLTVDVLEKIQEITETTTLPSLSNQIVTVHFNHGMSINQVNTFAMIISYEFKIELTSIYQSLYGCRITFT